MFKSVRMFLITLATVAMIGCGSFVTLKENPTVSLVVKYAVMKVIEDSTDPFGRAEKIVDIADRVLVYIEDDKVTTVYEIDTIIKKYIDWDSMQPSDKMLVDHLLETIETDLESKVQQNVISVEELVKVVDYVKAVRSTAAMMSTKAE